MGDFNKNIERNYTIEDLEQLLDSIPYEVYLKDINGRYLYANKASADKVGMRKEQIIGKLDYDFRPKEMAKICVEGDKTVLERGKETFIEDKIIHGDIETAYELFKTIIYNNKNKKQMIGGIAKFIVTDKSVSKYIIKNTESIMNNPEELNSTIENTEIITKLKYAVNADDIAIYLYDSKTKKMNINKHIGKNKEIFSDNYTITDKIHGLYYNSNEFRIVETLTDGSIKYIYLLKNRSKLLGCIHTYYREKPQTIKEEFINYICLLLSFVHEKKNLTDDLNRELKMRREAQEKLQMMIDSAIDIYALAKREGSKFIWLETSNKCNKILGWTADDLNAISYLDLIHPDDKNQVKEMVSMHSKKHRKVCFSVNCKDGKWRTFDTSVDNLKNDLYMISAKDITLITELRRDKEDLESIVERESLKIEFFANLSHEFKTPLNIILATVQVILDGMKKNNTCPDYYKLEEYMKNIKQNSYRLVKLATNIIDMTKIDGGFFEINICNYNIVEVVENIVQSIAGYINENRRNIIFDTTEEEIITACDPNHIERIILNILSNAMKFTSAGGNIDVNIEVSQQCNKVIIRIRNDGQPIKVEDSKKIFERFTQSEHLLTRSTEGSGIGLALVKSLVEMHNGRIYVNTEFKEGTEFCIELPIRKIMNSKCDFAWKKNLNSKVEKFAVEFSDIYS